MIDTEESPHIPAYDLNIVAESKRQAYQPNGLPPTWLGAHTFDIIYST